MAKTGWSSSLSEYPRREKSIGGTSSRAGYVDSAAMEKHIAKLKRGNARKQNLITATMRKSGNEVRFNESKLSELTDEKVMLALPQGEGNLETFRLYFAKALDYAKMVDKSKNPVDVLVYQDLTYHVYSNARRIANLVNNDLIKKAIKYFEHKYPKLAK